MPLRDPSIRLKLGLLGVVPVLFAAAIIGAVLAAFLSSRESELLEEKTQRYAEMSALQLASAIEYADRATARETLDAVVRDSDIISVTLLGAAGEELYQYGAPMLDVVRDARVKRHGDRLDVSVPVIARDGRQGELIIAVTTEALDDTRVRVLGITWATAGAVTLFALLVALPFASRISRRIRQVSRYATRVAGGDIHADPLFTPGTDEVAQTAIAVTTMVERLRELMSREAERAATERDRLENMVAHRTEKLAERNRATQLVLDNVNQGLLTVSLDGTIVGEMSRMTESLIGSVHTGDAFATLIGNHDPSAGEALQVGFAQLVDDILPIEVAIAQLPVEINARGRVLEAAYTPVDSPHGRQLLVTLTDVTAEREGQEATEIEAETAAMFRSATIDRHGARRFLEDARRQIQVIGSVTSQYELRNALHTLKGNAALMGLEAWVARCHIAETRLGERGSLTNDERQGLVFAWGATDARIAPMLEARDLVEISSADFTALVNAAWRETSWHEVREVLRTATLEPTSAPLRRLAEHTQELAERRGYDVTVAVDDHGLRLDPDKWSSLWSALTHVARNTIVHAVQPGARTCVTFRSLLVDGHVAIEIADDGRGLQWDELRERARDVGLPHESRQDLVAAMFASRVTTRLSADHIGGRGVGLAAVAAACDELDVRIEVLTPPRGTTFRFHLPVPAAEAVTLQAA